MTHPYKNTPIKSELPFEKKQRATVIHCEPGKVILHVEKQSGCTGCHQINACSHKYAENLLDKSTLLTLDRSESLEVGQQVNIDIQGKDILFSAFLLYCVPILVLLITALIVNLMTQNQLVIFVSALLAMITTLFLIKKISKTYARNLLHKIIIKADNQ